MTLEEFRRNWLREYADPAPAPAAPAPGRLVLVPPQDAELIPRLVFREAFAVPNIERKPRPRTRQWGTRILWTLAAILAIGLTGFGIASIFEYASTYNEKYLVPADLDFRRPNSL